MRGLLGPYVSGLALYSSAVGFALALPSPSSPRSSDETSIGGVPHLARMADKATLASEHHLDFDLEYPCPKDRKLLTALSLGADEFQSLAGASSSDAELDRKLKDTNPAAYERAKAALLRFAHEKTGVAAELRPGKRDKHHRKSQAEDADGC